MDESDFAATDGELYEETGAAVFSINRLCAYTISRDGIYKIKLNGYS